MLFDSLDPSNGDGFDSVVLLYVISKEGAGGATESMGYHESLLGIEWLTILYWEVTASIDVASDVNELRVVPKQSSSHVGYSRNLSNSLERA